MDVSLGRSELISVTTRGGQTS